MIDKYEEEFYEKMNKLKGLGFCIVAMKLTESNRKYFKKYFDKEGYSTILTSEYIIFNTEFLNSKYIVLLII